MTIRNQALPCIARRKHDRCQRQAAGAKEEKEDAMKARLILMGFAAMWLGFTAASTAQQAAPSVPDRLTVTIDAQQTMPAVTKYEYGQFIEHIGSTMYSSLWAEMLDD